MYMIISIFPGLGDQVTGRSKCIAPAYYAILSNM